MTCLSLNRGFTFHTFAQLIKRSYQPLKLGNDNRKGFNQITTVDPVYFAGWERLQTLPPLKLRKLALMLDVFYGSYDLAQAVLSVHDAREGTDYWKAYLSFRKIM